MLKATYDIETKKLSGDEVSVSLPKAIELAKDLVRHPDGFLVFVDEYDDVLQFAYYHESVVVDVPIEEKEESLQATVTIEDYLKIIDGLSEPLGDYIKTLTLEVVSWNAAEVPVHSEGSYGTEHEQESDREFLQRCREEETKELTEYFEQIGKMTPDEKFEHYKKEHGDWFLSHHSDLHGEEFTPELVAYEDKVEALLDELRPTKRALSTARNSKDDDAALAAAQAIFLKWTTFSPLKKYAIERFEADYIVDRISVIHMRQGCPEDAIAAINAYYESPFYAHLLQRRNGKHPIIQKRLKRAQAMVERASRK